MDLGDIPDGSDISVTVNGVHHDPLNENLEETWSALGEQDVRSSASSDPGMLPPPIPVLSTALGRIIGQPIQHQGMSELSVLRAPNRTITSGNIYRRGSEEITPEPMAGRRKLTQQGEKIPRITSAGMFGRKSVTEEVEVDPNVNEKKKSAKSSRNDSETTKSRNQTTNEAGSSTTQKEEELQLDMFFQTMYNKTKKLSLVKQIELRREIRQMVMNAEKQEQVANRKKKTQESTGTIKSK